MVGVEVLDGFRYAGGPTNFEAIHFCGLPEAEVDTLVALGKITPAAVDLVGLSHAACG